MAPAKANNVSDAGEGDLFAIVVQGVYRFANSTPDRVPLSDYYDVETGKNLGMFARPVVGGFWARALLQKQNGVGQREREWESNANLTDKRGSTMIFA